ncbi:homoserine kinase [Arthrobacter sp. UM1]|uniref:homoserine kinase n=1 Tax=Arthrobacter sp. UM1 TaxID=2766776 RepID=UPI001CF6584C|nr:homoserine kinase [Arthrobacter sp. UM1]MCB4207221.1 homoserine kinase [Arthrobacter sp. UM1]
MSGSPRLRLGAGVVVASPATSANLGPGYDSLGLALELRDRVSVSVSREGRGEPRASVVVRGHGTGMLPADESHLVARLILEAWAERGADVSGLRLEIEAENVIPHARGLGSSASAAVTAFSAADALFAEEDRLGAEWVFQRASRWEGHPDNVAPAVFGGLTVSWPEDAPSRGEDRPRFRTHRAEVSPGVRAVVGIPGFEVSTDAVRRALPEEVPHGVAADNSARAALLTLALTSAPELLLEATRDFLHQDARAAAMLPSHEAMTSLRAEGVPAVVSGAGPTVLALVRSDDERDAALAEFSRRGFECVTPEFARVGARVEEAAASR